MAHDIFGTRFVAVRVPAWHGIGHLFDTPVLPSEAVERADLNAVPRLVPLVGIDGDTRIETNKFLVLGQDGTQLGVSGEGFELTPLATALPVLDELSSQFPLSAAGTLRSGGEVFFTLGAGKDEIAGEEYENYLVYRHSYVPGVAHQIMWTPVRVVCRNTLVSGTGSATLKLSV